MKAATRRALTGERMPGCYDDPNASTGSQPLAEASGPTADPVPEHGLRVLRVSVRGNHGHLVGTGHLLDLNEPGAVPAGIGTRFADLDEIKRYVRTELRGLGVFWQVRVIDDDATVVMYGFRAGPGGTGERWTWRPSAPPATGSATGSPPPTRPDP